MLHLYHEFIRSIRSGDLELYIYCLLRISNCFFNFKYPNYARWLVCGYCESKAGFSYFTNLTSVRKRWADTYFLRMEVFLKVLTKLDVTTKNISQDLKPNRLIKNTRSLQKILRSIPEKMTTFSEKKNKGLLFKKGTGKLSRNFRVFVECQ